MRYLTLLLCLAFLAGLPAEARRRPRAITSPATVAPSTAINPATTGFSPTMPFNDVKTVTLSTQDGRPHRRGYGYYRRHQHSYQGSASSGIPGYDRSLPDKTLPGY